ncbi:MAG: hypothetical protein KKE05_00060 [Nanoarchaeota archaeon]|nr:hypothetical protein [Nanoarchaeota archaeon]
MAKEEELEEELEEEPDEEGSSKRGQDKESDEESEDSEDTEEGLIDSDLKDRSRSIIDDVQFSQFARNTRGSPVLEQMAGEQPMIRVAPTPMPRAEGLMGSGEDEDGFRYISGKGKGDEKTYMESEHISAKPVREDLTKVGRSEFHAAQESFFRSAAQEVRYPNVERYMSVKKAELMDQNQNTRNEFERQTRKYDPGKKFSAA